MRRARPARTHGERQTKIRARRRSRSHLARHGVSRPCACVGFLMETVCATNSHRRGTNITGSDPIGEHDGDRDRSRSCGRSDPGLSDSVFTERPLETERL